MVIGFKLKKCSRSLVVTDQGLRQSRIAAAVLWLPSFLPISIWTQLRTQYGLQRDTVTSLKAHVCKYIYKSIQKTYNNIPSSTTGWKQFKQTKA